MLKHLRRRRYKDAFEALSRESGVQLEGPIQTRLWDALVEKGDYKLAEEIFDEAAKGNKFMNYHELEFEQMCVCILLIFYIKLCIFLVEK